MSLVFRILSQNHRFPDRHTIHARLRMEGFPVLVESVHDDNETLLLVTHEDGGEICMVSRIACDGRDSATRKKAALIRQAETGFPQAGARRTAAWLKSATQIFEIHLLEDVYRAPGWEVATLIRRQLIETTRGIRHTDFEGFTNPEGRLVVCEYPESATDRIEAAVWKWGRWRPRSVHLANAGERARFLAGK